MKGDLSCLPKTLHLGCGQDYRDGEHNVDAVRSVGPDETVDLDSTPWPWPDAHFRYIRAYHVIEHLEDTEATLRECARVLESGGRLEVRVPMGLDAFADPDHKHVWEWRTPEFYCGKRHWDTDVGLRVVHRDVRMWVAGQQNPLAAVDKLSWKVRRWFDGVGPWCFNQPGMSGEFFVFFKKP